MTREPDIGWQHGKMVGGHRHHVQCNYCNRSMFGGVTRFKKHLASRKGEIKGCDAVPREVRDIIRKHLAQLAAGKTKKEPHTMQMSADFDALNTSLSDEKDMESDKSDREMAAAKLESLRTIPEEYANCPIINESKPEQLMVVTREFFDAFSSVPGNAEQGLAPPRATDVGWAHGTMVNGNRQKVKCRYCNKVIPGGGVSRLKQHLAGERGNVAPCEKVPEDVKAQMQQLLGFKVLESLKKQKVLAGSSQEGREEGNNDDVHRIPSTSITHENSGKRRGRPRDEGTSSRRKRNKKLPVHLATTMAQSGLQITFASQDSIDQADIAVAKFMYEAGIPFTASNSPYFQLMADAIAAVGPGYKMPSYHALRGKLLNKIVHKAGDLCQELRKSWEVTGCSVIADRWIDTNGCIILNFFIYCPKSTMFLKSVDVSNISTNADALTNLFDSIVQEVGPKNIVHFITDCSSCFKAAGKMLMNKHKTFFWSACAAHCITLMLEELEKLDLVKEILARAKRITQFIYNHAWVLNFMRKTTGGRDIVQPAPSKSETNFVTLQIIVSLKDELQQMFSGTAWVQSAFSRQKEGIDVTDIILDPLFWSSCIDILKVTKPIITVLHIADSETPSMGYIYEAMENLKRNIKVEFNNNESDYLPWLKVIDQIWEENLHSPLHAAACYLNPSIFYNPSFSTNKVIQKGLLDCIETLEPDLSSQDMITRHITFYEDAVGDFCRPVAVQGRGSLPPATWWSLYASDYQDLQRFAVRILSQTCSGTRMRKWSMFEGIQLKTGNSLEQERLNDLIFVHYNLSLQQRQTSTLGGKPLVRGACDPICLEGMNVNAADWVEDPGVLKGEDLGWMDVEVPGDSFDTPGGNNKVSNTNDPNKGFDHRGSDESNGNIATNYW